MFGGMTPPMIQNSMNGGGIIVRHREYIGDLQSSIVFTNRNFPLNPGLTSTFPWLAQIANAFEQYRFRGLIFEFKSLSADALISAAQNIGQGTVIMATQYNALSPGFSSKIEMENYEFANSAKPSISFMHPVECAMYQTPNTPLYVRSGAIPAGADERLYDLGNFCVATQGLPSPSGTIGELWCTFEIEFFKPKYNSDTAEGLGIDRFQSDNEQAGGTFRLENGGTTDSCINPMGNLEYGFYAGNIGTRLRYYISGLAPNQLCSLIIDFPPESTEIGETFRIDYCITLGALGGPPAGVQTNAIITSNGTGMVPVQMYEATLPTSTFAGYHDRQSLSYAAGAGQKIYYTCNFKVEGDPASSGAGTPWFPGIRSVQILNLANALRYDGVAQDYHGLANVIVTKLPTNDTFDPMHGPTDNTVFGTDV